ncbi:MAG: YjfI family protein [Alphaproteobacteria bacterium]|nr:YjfI family protein [Alphaproteobacteria bacterium]
MSMKSSYYQSRYRARLREKGYVKRELWIPPEYTKILKDCETAIRAGVSPIIPKFAAKPTPLSVPRSTPRSAPRSARESEMSEDNNWTTETLCQALAQSEAAGEGAIRVELIEGVDPGILITMTEFGDLPLLMSVSGSQILVETLLWPVDEVKDTAVFNDLILRTHKLLPLSTFGIRQGPDGKDYYEMFGSLSAGSILESVQFEAETLADNAMQAAEAYQSDLQDVA